MKQNKYDDPVFFEKYSRMDRSVKGLAGAGEWPALKKMLPVFKGRRVLDLGCGFGWHCRYAAEQGAASVLGIDISENMLQKARKLGGAQIEYRRMPIEDIDFPPQSFDIVLSSLAFHYIKDFDTLSRRIFECLSGGGELIFSAEHPIFTAEGRQDWYYGEDGKALHWPVDRYFEEGGRTAVFLGERVEKYHKTLTTYLKTLLKAGFILTDIEEPQPTAEMLAQVPGMTEELRRPMMLLVAAKKP